MKVSLSLLLVLALGIFSSSLQAQEFSKEAVLYLEGGQGINTSFGRYPDLYVGGLDLQPQFTVVNGFLRLGANAGLHYTDQHLLGLFGPMAAIKLGTINVSQVGSLANIQLVLEHLWGTFHQRLFGGGLKSEVGKIAVLGITCHRDYGSNSWWFQFTTAFNLLHAPRKHPDDPTNSH